MQVQSNPKATRTYHQVISTSHGTNIHSHETQVLNILKTTSTYHTRFAKPRSDTNFVTARDYDSRVTFRGMKPLVRILRPEYRLKV